MSLFFAPREKRTMDDASDAAPLLASLRERAMELEAAVRLVRVLVKRYLLSQKAGKDEAKSITLACNSMIE